MHDDHTHGTWRRRWKVIVVGAVTYVILWAATHVMGRSDIESVVIAAMHFPGSRSEFTRISSTEQPSGMQKKVYYCRTVAYGPFIVRVDYGWIAGSLSGHGASTVYLWFFGMNTPIYSLDEWSS